MKLRDTEEKKNSEIKYLRRCGIAIELDFRQKDKQPCLINLAADPGTLRVSVYLTWRRGVWLSIATLCTSFSSRPCSSSSPPGYKPRGPATTRSHQRETFVRSFVSHCGPSTPS